MFWRKCQSFHAVVFRQSCFLGATCSGCIAVSFVDRTCINISLSIRVVATYSGFCCRWYIENREEFLCVLKSLSSKIIHRVLEVSSGDRISVRGKVCDFTHWRHYDPCVLRPRLWSELGPFPSLSPGCPCELASCVFKTSGRWECAICGLSIPLPTPLCLSRTSDRDQLVDKIKTATFSITLNDDRSG